MSFFSKPLDTALVFLSGFFFSVLLLPSFAWSAPQIIIQTPSSNETIDGKEVLLLSGEINDLRGLKSLKIFLNDLPLDEHTTRGIVVTGKDKKHIKSLGGISVWPFKIKIPTRALKKGANVIRLTATNLEAQRADIARDFIYKPSQASIYVVSIGVNQYKDSKIPALNYAENDARAFAEYFSEDVGLSPSNITLLVGEEAHQRNIKKVLGTTLKRQATANDQVILYFAGHGAPEPEPSTENADGLEKYLLPFDTNLDSLYSSAIPMREIQYLIQRFSSERVVLVLDTCFSGDAGGSGRTINFKTLGLRSGIISTDFYKKMSQGKGKMILTASGGNQLSHELDEFEHGAFTYYLLEAMKGNGDNDNDGIVTVNEAYQYVSNAVPKVTSQNQFPQLFGGGGSVVLGKSNQTKVAMNLPTRHFKGGRLIVQVKPAEAEILIDGVSRGQGPIMNTVLSEGSYNVRVRMNNYISQSKDIMIGKSSLNQLEFELEKPEADDAIIPPPSVFKALEMREKKIQAEMEETERLKKEAKILKAKLEESLKAAHDNQLKLGQQKRDEMEETERLKKEAKILKAELEESVRAAHDSQLKLGLQKRAEIEETERLKNEAKKLKAELEKTLKAAQENQFNFGSKKIDDDFIAPPP